MDQTRTCPQCGAILPSEALEGLCPRCMAKVVFGPDEVEPDQPEAKQEKPKESDEPEGDLEQQRTGTMIGRYKLLEQIGEGGFGVVYMAEQVEPVQRKVALKIIKAGMDTNEVVARFEAERQALALMDHPHIAKVLDAGTTGQPRPSDGRGVGGEGFSAGRPFFVMELVRGIPITEFCDQKQLSTAERLQLFMKVCSAVQHAHQKGIIHRDLKPTNILVTLHDGKPAPKVIDFGVAKALGQKLTEKTLFTAFAQMIGTPAYMSPEQAELSGLDVDTRSDIYSLGVLLYELLTGVTPFDRETLAKAALDEVRRMIRETEPPKPSTRLQTLGEKLTTVAKCRQTQAPKLVHLVRGDLDWIVMKCLEKDRGRRYDTANGLAMDLQRHLDDEPIVARPPSRLYEFQKTVRRHKFGFAAAAALVIVLALGAVVSTWQAVRATRSKREAIVQRHIAEAVGNFLQRDLLRQANVAEQEYAMSQLGGGFEPKGNPTIKELLDRAAVELSPERIDLKFPNQPEVQASILKTVGDSYTSIGEYEKAVEFHTRAYALTQIQPGADDNASLIVLQSLALAQQESGNIGEAIKIYVQLRDTYRRRDTDGVNLFLTLNNLAVAYEKASRLPDAIRLLEGMRDRIPPQFEPRDPTVLRYRGNLGLAYLEVGRVADAIELLKDVHAKQAERLGPNDSQTLLTMNNLAMAHQWAGNLPKAIELFEQAHQGMSERLSPTHPNTLVALSSLARAYSRSGDYQKAISLFEQALEPSMKLPGPDSPQTLVCMEGLAEACQHAGDLPRAINLFEQAHDGLFRVLGPTNQLTLLALNDLASAYFSSGNFAKATELFEKVRVINTETLEPDHPSALTTLFNLGHVYWATTNLDRARQCFLDAAEGIEKHQFQHQHAQLIISGLTDCLVQMQKHDEAAIWQAKWIEVIKAREGTNSLAYAGALAALASNSFKREKWADAALHLTNSLTLFAKLRPDDWRTFYTQCQLGACLLRQLNLSGAEPLLHDGHEGLERRAEQIPAGLRRARLGDSLRWLAELCDANGQTARAAEWKKKLAEFEQATTPSKP